MATYTYDPPTRTLTTVLTVTEATALARAVQEVGPNAVKQLLDAWLQQQITHQAAVDNAVVLQAIPTATPAQIASIKTTLGLP